MQEKNNVGVLIVMALLFIGTTTPVLAEQNESFWSGWFGRSDSQRETFNKMKSDDEKGIRKHAAINSTIGEKKASKKALFSDKERSSIRSYYGRTSDDDDGREKHQDKHQNKHQNKHQDKHQDKHRGHNDHKTKNLPYGLQKKLARGGTLPPGWQDKLVRGEVLDGDALRYSEVIPDELARRLPRLNEGEAVRRVGDKVVRVVEGNGTILDVIDLADVFLR